MSDPINAVWKDVLEKDGAGYIKVSAEFFPIIDIEQTWTVSFEWNQLKLKGYVAPPPGYDLRTVSRQYAVLFLFQPLIILPSPPPLPGPGPAPGPLPGPIPIPVPIPAPGKGKPAVFWVQETAFEYKSGGVVFEALRKLAEVQTPMPAPPDWVPLALR